jgi:hypothetical protein
MKSKFILSAMAFLIAPALFSQSTYDAAILGYTGFRYACEDGVTPVVRIQNVGTATMASCVVETWKGGGLVSSFDWQLAVPAAPNDIRQPALPLVENVQPDDVLEIRIISVNGQEDEGDLNNVLMVSMDEVPVSSFDEHVTVQVHTGSEMQALSWQIRDLMGIVVATGGPYETTLELHEELVGLAPLQCHQILFSGAGPMGVPMGYFQLLSSNGEPFFTLPGELMEGPVNKGFITGGNVGIAAGSRDPEYRIGPNPTDAVVRITSYNGPVQVRVSDAAGRRIAEIPRPAHVVDLDLSGQDAGIYFLTLITADGARHSRQVIRN